jgi:hypothetical protein
VYVTSGFFQFFFFQVEDGNNQEGENENQEFLLFGQTISISLRTLSNLQEFDGLQHFVG